MATTNQIECPNCGSHLFPTGTDWECAACLNNVEVRSKVFSDAILRIIRDRIIPPARINSNSLLLADWMSVLSMAHWLGFNIKAEQTKLSKALKENHCEDFVPCDLAHHRRILGMCDLSLNVDKYLSKFEADLAYLKTALNAE